MSLAVVLFSALSSVAQTSVQWRDSLTVLQRQIAESPWSSDLHLRKAAVNLQLQQWQYAADEYSDILSREPYNAAALFYRAYAYSHLHLYPLARRDCESLLAVFPTHFEGRLSLAAILQKMGRTTEAVDHLNTLAMQHPDSSVVYVMRSQLEASLGQTAAAVYDCRKAVALSPSDADNVAALADLLISDRQYSAARRELDAAVSRGIPRGLLAPWYEKLRKKKK